MAQSTPIITPTNAHAHASNDDSPDKNVNNDIDIVVVGSPGNTNDTAPIMDGSGTEKPSDNNNNGMTDEAMRKKKCRRRCRCRLAMIGGGAAGVIIGGSLLCGVGAIIGGIGGAVLTRKLMKRKYLRKHRMAQANAADDATVGSHGSAVVVEDNGAGKEEDVAMVPAKIV
eukprot:CAMPEP_0198115200 /NCGR_PEP_ID=MMETSP1442-20131203/6377_1 /TAXON_ID= /ORGANISM="Craspedostauros australis, Strain CCMP3328" /LENGTH=169 /DNA_ID=CAMNT_0043772663 /DNA_START=80 /DNA_END=589 /DNA_ORIENTATION=+